MLRPVVNHVASLTEGFEVPEIIVRRVIVEMGGGENDPCAQTVIRFGGYGYSLADATAMAVAPDLQLLVPPPSITEMTDDLAMRPGATLAPALGSLEPHHVRDLRPVDRVKPAVLRSDRHLGRLRRFDPLR